jgi:hypothetical protein
LVGEIDIEVEGDGMRKGVVPETVASKPVASEMQDGDEREKEREVSVAVEGTRKAAARAIDDQENGDERDSESEPRRLHRTEKGNAAGDHDRREVRESEEERGSREVPSTEGGRLHEGESLDVS